MMPEGTKGLDRGRAMSRPNDEGWALLGLMLALGVMSIMLVSTVVPNVQMQVQRDKEVEMIYRGEQMAAGIARYYNRGNLAPLQLLVPPQYGYLLELSKLREGITIGVRDIKFVRPSAMIDPMTSSEWEPVRARDPRIMKVLQAWAAENLVPIPPQYLLIAAPPQTSVFKTPESSEPATPPPAVEGPGRPTPPNPIQGRPVTPPPNANNPDNGDDDDDDDADDPLAHLFGDDQPGHSNAPIVGVAPRRKGTATKPYLGLDQYQDWVFIYIPKVFNLRGPGTAPNPDNVPGRRPPRRVSQ